MSHGEEWLLANLSHYGVDVYVDGTFATLGDRLGYVIATNGIRYAIAGHYAGKRETYARAYERIYGKGLPAVPRETDSKHKPEVST